MADAHNMSHSSQVTHKFGENVYAYFGSPISDSYAATNATKCWYSEEAHYNYSNPTSSTGKIGHFTQVVWKGSKEFGIGVARSGNAIYVSGSYDPPGNYRGAEKSNVLPI